MTGVNPIHEEAEQITRLLASLHRRRRELLADPSHSAVCDCADEKVVTDTQTTTERIAMLDDEARDVVGRLVDSILKKAEEPPRTDPDQVRGWTVDRLHAALSGSRARGEVDGFECWCTDEDVRGGGWKLHYVDGTTTDALTFAEAVDAYEALAAETGTPDPLIMLALDSAKREGWITSFEHENFEGQALYTIRAELDGEEDEHAGFMETTRAALWGLLHGGMRERRATV